MRSWLSCVFSLCFAAGCGESPADPGSGGTGGEQGGGGAGGQGGGGAAGAGGGSSGEWARSFGGPQRDSGQNIAVDGDGNLYVSGFFEGTATFGEVTLDSPGTGGFVAKLSPEGTVLWATAIPSTDLLDVRNVAVGPDGNLYLGGTYSGTATFGAEEAIAPGYNDAFVASLDAAGAFRWALVTGASAYARGLGLAIDSQGAIVVIGYFSGEADLGGTPLTAMKDETYVAGLDTQGTVLWVTTAGGQGSTHAHAIAARPDGGTVVAGAFYGLPGATIDAGGFTLTSQGSNDVLVLFLDAGGKVESASSFGGPHWEEAWAVTVDEKGDTYVAGQFNQSSTFGATTLKSEGLGVFVAGLAPAGDLGWVTGGGGPSDVTAVSLCADGSGHAFVTGLFSGQTSFGDTKLAGTGLWDLYVARAGEGGFDWAIGAGGEGNDYGGALARAPSGALLLTGFFEGSATFGDTPLKAAGDSDVLVWKLPPGP
jgi:hypothetical protein